MNIFKKVLIFFIFCIPFTTYSEVKYDIKLSTKSNFEDIITADNNGTISNIYIENKIGKELSSSKHKIFLSYHVADENENIIEWDGLRTNLEMEENGTINMNYKAPSTPGKYFLLLDIVEEGVAWYANANGQKFLYKIPISVVKIEDRRTIRIGIKL